MLLITINGDKPTQSKVFGWKHKAPARRKNKFVFIVTEVEIVSLNFISVSFPSETPTINVLLFADDTVLVTSWYINEQLEI